MRIKIEVDLEDVTWECGDCGNRYGPNVFHCPNTLLDQWMLEHNNKTERKINERARSKSKIQ